MAFSVYDYVAFVHDYRQVVIARENVRDAVGSGDVRAGRGYASIRIDGNGSRGRSGQMNSTRQCQRADQDHYCKYDRKSWFLQRSLVSSYRTYRYPSTYSLIEYCST